MTTPGTIICWDSGNLASEVFVGDRDGGVGSQVPIILDLKKKKNSFLGKRSTQLPSLISFDPISYGCLRGLPSSICIEVVLTTALTL